MNPAWIILQKILNIFNFSEADIKKVCEDMDEMVQVELTASLFEDLSQSEKEEIEQKIGDRKGKEAMEIIVNFFKGRVSKAEIKGVAQEIAEELLGEYITNILSKVKNQATRDKIEAVLAEASEIIKEK